MSVGPSRFIDRRHRRQHRKLLGQRLMRRLKRRAKQSIWLGMMPIAIALSPPATKPVPAAETITFSYGPIERSISVESLETYVEEGRVTAELAPYLGYVERFDPTLPEQIQSLLSQRVDTDVVTVAQFGYTPQGEYVLNQAGDVFRTGARLSGAKGLRAAAILSAADEVEGLTLLNVFKQFPTPMLRVDIRRGLAIARQVNNTLSQSRQALDFIAEISFESATVPFPADTSAAQLNELVSRPGPFQSRQISLRMKASTQPVDVYLPQNNYFSIPSTQAARAYELGQIYGSSEQPSTVSLPNSPAPLFSQTTPAVIISHGLGNDRETYTYLAQFLATHGFAVITVEHPGSSADQFDALVAGRTNLVVPDTEFISRPLLISNVLDELQERAQINKNLADIDFNNVGIIGQSFGGYTALTVAGAPVNFESLRHACPPEFTFNPSVLLQCQALNIAPPTDQNEGQAINFRDARIRAVIAINPMDSVILGEDSLSNVEVPVLMMAGSADTIAPALPEQVLPFTWLTDIDRYLLVMEGGTHFSTLGTSGRETFDLPPQIIGPNPQIAQRYTQMMSLAFLSTYLYGDRRYQPVLSSAFTTRISDPDLPLSFITGLTPDDLRTRLRSEAADERSLKALEQAIEKEIARIQESPPTPENP